MHNLIDAFPLYNFLRHCNLTEYEKTVLDCGAGGGNPPLSLFYEFGYKTCGIEISEAQIKKAVEFCIAHNMDLNIIKGDMTNLPFDDGEFSFLFSYNTSVHMQKCDFAGAIREFSRVLIPGGLCFVNFLSTDCDTYGRGIETAPGEFLQTDCGEEVQYTHYKDDEPISLFDGFDIIYSEKSKIKRNVDGRNYTSGYLNFILKRL